MGLLAKVSLGLKCRSIHLCLLGVCGFWVWWRNLPQPCLVGGTRSLPFSCISCYVQSQLSIFQHEPSPQIDQPLCLEASSFPSYFCKINHPETWNMFMIRSFLRVTFCEGSWEFEARVQDYKILYISVTLLLPHVWYFLTILRYSRLVIFILSANIYWASAVRCYAIPWR